MKDMRLTHDRSMDVRVVNNGLGFILFWIYFSLMEQHRKF